MADSDNQIFFFLSQSATGPRQASLDAKAYLGDTAELLTVPYFPLPAADERFEDTEGRIPYLKELTQYLISQDDSGSVYWYAHVLPKDGDTQATIPTYVTVQCLSKTIVLRCSYPNKSLRYIACVKPTQAK